MLISPNCASRGFQAFQRDAASSLMQEYSVDEQQAGAVAEIGDLMLIPDLFDNCLRHKHLEE